MSDARPSRRSDLIKSALLYVLPHHAISRCLFKVTRIRSRLAQPFMRWFVRTYGVNMAEAENSDLSSYASFNAFFTRALKPGARSIDNQPQSLACPVDAAISEIGSIENGQVLQAKGHVYRLAELLASETLADHFANGRFATLYLSPRDYHRIHMPIDGQLLDMTYVPGRLFSVAPHTVRTIPRLFARNERLVCRFQTAAGEMIMVLVGAINVAAIETVWSGLVTPPAGTRIQRWNYPDNHAVRLNKGAEMGRFNMGSTVILITENRCQWQPELGAGQSVQLGQCLAQFEHH